MLITLGKHVAIYGAADFVFRFIGFAVFPIYAHVFSVEEFGIYALITTSVGIVALFANLGLNNAVQRYYWDPGTGVEAQPKIVSTGLATLVVWSCLIVLVLTAGLYPLKDVVAARYGISWNLMLIALLTIIPEQVLQYCLDTLRLHFAPWKFVVVSLLRNMLGVAVGLVLILRFDAGLKGLFLGGLIGALTAVPVALVLIRKDLRPVLDGTIVKRLAGFGYPFVFVGLAYWIFGAADRWMLAELGSTTQVGLYAIAYKFAAVILFLNNAFGQAWSPAAMKMRRDLPEYRMAYARVLSIWYFLLLLVGATMAAFAPEALALLTPPEYWDAAAALGVLVMGVVVSGTTQVTAIGISLERKTRLFALAGWITATVNVSLNLLFIPTWGALGAAFATFLSYVLLTALYLAWSQKLHPIPIEKRNLIYCAGLTVLVLVLAGGSVFGASLSSILARIALLASMVIGAFALGILDFRSFVALAMAKGKS